MTRPTAPYPESTARRRSVAGPWLVGCLAYATVALRGAGVLQDPDVYAHIAIGRWILQHGTVPHQDIFSNAMSGAAWVPHEWLAEVATAWTYDHLGWTGLVVLAGLLFALALALLCRALEENLPISAALGFCALAWGLCFPHLLMRPHLFTFPFLVVWIATLVGARAANRPPHWSWALLMIPWANLHGDFMIGLVAAAAFAAEAAVEAPDRRALHRAALGWGVFIVVAVAGAMATPNGLAGLAFPIELMRLNFVLSWVGEWQSPNFQQPQPLEFWLLLVLAAGLWSGIRLPPFRIAMLLALLHAALQHQRQAELLGLVAPLLVAPALAAAIASSRSLAALNIRFVRLAPLTMSPPMRGKLAAISAFLLATAASFVQLPIPDRVDGYTPRAALAAATQAGLSGRVFNAYRFGGYLIYAGVPPFIDGRVDMYGDDFVRQFADLAALPDLLRKYDIAWTLLEPTSMRAKLMDQLPGWHRLYADDVAVIHVRNGTAKASSGD